MNRNRTIIKRKQFFEYRCILIALLLSYTLYAHNYVANFFILVLHILIDCSLPILIAWPASHVAFTLIELFQHLQLTLDIKQFIFVRFVLVHFFKLMTLHF